ncbi:MAG: multiheme c-type cytochrome [Myxococcota bacterium]
MAQAYLTAGLTTSMVALVTLTAIDSAYAGPDHIGAERCGACHQAEYQAWRKTPHAQALARLTEQQQQNKLCRSCHTMDPWSDDPALAGVQCESCHGAGRPYAPELVMRDKKLAALMGLKTVNEATCENCHRADAPRLRAFDYAKLVKQVMHLSPEPATPTE